MAKKVETKILKKSPAVVSCVNLKGGVGKTAISVNFAAYCGSKNLKVLLVDLDPQTNATFSCISVEKWQEHAAKKGTVANLNAIYYKDHPVELELWGQGTFRMGFSELLSYVERHPKLSSFDNTKTGVQFLHDEYATLSRAVHASAVDFRMTESAAAVLLWNADKARAGKWSSRESKVIEGICLVFAFMFSEKLTGTQLSNLRTMLSFAVSASKKAGLKKDLKITIPS
jgi:hypothetical protein